MFLTIVNLNTAISPEFHAAINAEYGHICVVSRDVEEFKVPVNEEFCKGLLVRRFDDVGYVGDDENITANYKIEEPKGMDEKDAEEIVLFAERAIAAKVDNMLINCEAGISRSPGIAVALNQIYNNGEDGWIQSIHNFGVLHHNKLVRDKILEAHKKLYENGTLKAFRIEHQTEE